LFLTELVVVCVCFGFGVYFYVWASSERLDMGIIYQTLPRIEYDCCKRSYYIGGG
jgi:hypothetical protein